MKSLLCSSKKENFFVHFAKLIRDQQSSVLCFVLDTGITKFNPKLNRDWWFGQSGATLSCFLLHQCFNPSVSKGKTISLNRQIMLKHFKVKYDSMQLWRKSLSLHNKKDLAARWNDYRLTCSRCVVTFGWSVNRFVENLTAQKPAPQLLPQQAALPPRSFHEASVFQRTSRQIGDDFVDGTVGNVLVNGKTCLTCSEHKDKQRRFKPPHRHHRKYRFHHLGGAHDRQHRVNRT